jgi:ribulose-5-phosphate 4-epimerase/fuculose-1-phosphate aldolase
MEQGLDGRAVLARDLGNFPALIMRNHGLLTCGRTIGEAFWLMHTLERACAAQIAALAGGAALYPVTDKTSRWFGALVSEKDFSLDRGALSWPGLLDVLDSVDSSFRD